MTTPRLRKPRFKRCSIFPSVSLTERDVRILALVDRHRFIQSHHLTMLLAGSRQHLIRRLGRLYHAGFLERPSCQLLLRHRIASSFVYCLTHKGQSVLQQHSIARYATVPRLDATSAALSLAHSIRITDVVVALSTAATAHSVGFLSHHEWRRVSSTADWKKLSQLRWTISISNDSVTVKTTVIPDAAFALQSPGAQPSYFVLEVDRGTMPVTRGDFSQSSFLRKIIAYKETRRTGALWKRFQIPGFRVLIVAESARRLASLQAVTAGCFQRGESEMFLFACTSQLIAMANTFACTWQTCSGHSVVLSQTLATIQSKADFPH